MLLSTLVSAFTGTLLMTVFSYIVSRTQEKQFREPEILAYLIKYFIPADLSKSVKFIFGCIAHYLAGIAFMFTYWLLWEYTALEPTFLFGLFGGFISGFAGVLIWKITFFLHPDPPNIDFKGYYLQLIAAHIIFGVVATETFLLMN